MWLVGGRCVGEEGLKIYAGKSEVCVDGMRLEHASDFKYLGCVLDESGTDEAEYRRKVLSGRRVVGSIRSPVNARGLQLECARVLHTVSHCSCLFLRMVVRQ